MKKIIALLAAFILAANTSVNVFAQVSNELPGNDSTDSSPFFLGTGKKLMVTEGESAFEVDKLILDTSQAYGSGDINGDGTINVLDFIRLKNYFLNSSDEEYVLYSGDASKDYIYKTLQLSVRDNVPDILADSASFDVNNDGVVNSLDLVEEISYLIGGKKFTLDEFNPNCFTYEAKNPLKSKEQFITFYGQCDSIFSSRKIIDSKNIEKLSLSQLLDECKVDFDDAGIEKIFYASNVIAFGFRGKEYIMKVDDSTESIVYEEDEDDVSELKMSLYWIRERCVTIYELIDNNTLLEVSGYTFVHAPDADFIFSSYCDNRYVEELPEIVNIYLEDNGHFEIIDKEFIAKY